METHPNEYQVVQEYSKAYTKVFSKSSQEPDLSSQKRGHETALLHEVLQKASPKEWSLRLKESPDSRD